MTAAGAMALTAVVLWITAGVCAGASTGRNSGPWPRPVAWALLALGSVAMICAVWLAAFEVHP